MITGDLATDSPSLISKLKQLFPNEVLANFTQKYQEISTRPEILAENNWREAGVNFNPRLARLLEILLLDAGITSPLQLLQALDLIGHPLLTPKNIKSDLVHPEILPALLLAIILDELRHLQYQNSPKDLYQELQIAFTDLSQKIQGTPLLDTHLFKKASTAFRLYQKFA